MGYSLARPVRLALIVCAGLAALAWYGLLPSPAAASRRQVPIIEDESVLSDPAAALATFRSLGATTVRVIVHWSLTAPARTALRASGNFDAGDPNDYPDGAWAPYDRIVEDAAASGMTVDLTIAGGAPRWAEGPGIPPQGADPYYAWKPSAKQYGEFVHAVGERYDGAFTPPGASAPLPAVHFWALWNEPNFGQDLAPQATRGSTVSVAPGMYRALLTSGWAALQQTGHAGDTIVVGELAAYGQAGPVNRKHPQGLPGDYAQTKPVPFLRTLYCVDSRYRELRGRYATARGCPVNAAGSRRFRARNPALFKASGVGDHPYLGNHSPVDRRVDPNFATFPQVPALARLLDRLNRVYGSHKRFPIYNDEFGEITRPPQSAPYVSPATAALYLNWSEYLSWRDPRLASYAQFLLDDPVPHGGRAGFASGLLTYGGLPKATFFAYRLPLYMPRTTLRRGRAAEVWGDVRPASFSAFATGQNATATIQFQARGRGPFQTIKRVRVAASTPYFDLRVRFPTSGRVRLAFDYPTTDALLAPDVAGTTITSRVLQIRAR